MGEQIQIILTFPLCYSIMSHATLVLYYHAFMLTLPWHHMHFGWHRCDTTEFRVYLASTLNLFRTLFIYLYCNLSKQRNHIFLCTILINLHNRLACLMCRSQWKFSWLLKPLVFYQSHSYMMKSTLIFGEPWPPNIARISYFTTIHVKAT